MKILNDELKKTLKDTLIDSLLEGIGNLFKNVGEVMIGNTKKSNTSLLSAKVIKNYIETGD